jgi:hypothetical protein
MNCEVPQVVQCRKHMRRIQTFQLVSLDWLTMDESLLVAT